MLKTYQKYQSDRLAAPKRGSVADLEALAMFERGVNMSTQNNEATAVMTLESPRDSRSYLRKTTQ